MRAVSGTKSTVKKRLIVISVILYLLVLMFLVASYLQNEKSLQAYGSILAGFSQPPQPVIPAERPVLAGNSAQLVSQIKELDAFLGRYPSSLDTDYELLEMTRRHSLEIISLSSRGEKKQPLAGSSYRVHSYTVILQGARQDIVNMLGELQSFRPGLLTVEAVNLTIKKQAFQVDISFSVYSREPRSNVAVVEPAGERDAVGSKIDSGKSVERK